MNKPKIINIEYLEPILDEVVRVLKLLPKYDNDISGKDLRYLFRLFSELKAILQINDENQYDSDAHKVWKKKREMEEYEDLSKWLELYRKNADTEEASIFLYYVLDRLVNQIRTLKNKLEKANE